MSKESTESNGKAAVVCYITTSCMVQILDDRISERVRPNLLLLMLPGCRFSTLSRSC